MKVYVVTQGAYSDYHICCVCLNRETAEERARLFDDAFDKAEVEEYDTDEYQALKIEDGRIVRCDGKRQYVVDLEEYTDGGKRHESVCVQECDIRNWRLDETCWRTDAWYDTPCGVDVKGNYWQCVVYARDEAEARRIAYDRIAAQKWEIVERGEDEGKGF